MSWRDKLPKQRKIAVVGRMPWSMMQAPYDDPEWQIWVCNGAVSTETGPKAPRYDVCFDVHDYPWATQNFHRDWMRAQEKPIVLGRLRRECPNEVLLPREELTGTFGEFFTSSIAWMLAMAILCDPEEIGLWGVEMAHASEYGPQREACLHLLGWARGRGIKVSMPIGCGLLKAPLYGFHY